MMSYYSNSRDDYFKLKNEVSFPPKKTLFQNTSTFTSVFLILARFLFLLHQHSKTLAHIYNQNQHTDANIVLYSLSDISLKDISKH